MTIANVCEHGSLRRSCLVCELEAKVERLTRERDEARAEAARSEP